ncbi:hypothetical protein [Rubrivivax benzoatilyticus]|uniref:Polysaccharide pyruvyl transferase n=1 Tax=Rubrivivax benzoatilyticus TaxID=316997 RepID=A0ABX0HQV4_9BURK|nr:hypothetical protein [Rubrivivax benzoatilyticus]EGJ09768.1 hypothetical protein RBXJA2T_05533 [Rubrivivax benzoatilyticus JA2 = ATCC BAA-35]NHK97445.1 hypothetical protein [Rubrivivax benzoatilyticus]NHL22860.1 hypothetical protein [Rubrivivax benzoatilyticus]
MPDRPIAVICAHNPKNAGMYRVDLAARRYFEARGLRADLFVTQGRTGIGTLRFDFLRDVEQLGAYDRVVYWGDFLNNPLWGLRDYAGRQRPDGSVSSVDEWRSLYLEAKQRHPALRVIVAGGCALGAAACRDDPELAAAYRGFLQSADALVLRDPGSVAEVHQWLGPDRRVQLGFDCAALAPPAVAPKAARRGPFFVHGFGRGLPPADAAALVAETERHTGLRGVPVSWLGREGPRVTFGARVAWRLGWARHAHFCLTDIYHFSLCSMSVGTPAFVVTTPETRVDGTLNQHKKRLLFDMLGLQSMHLDWTPRWREDLEPMLHGWQRLADEDAPWSCSFQAGRERLLGRLDQLFMPARSGRPIVT